MILKIGDTVEATKLWRRMDSRSFLKVGERARVSSVFQKDSASPQIIGIEITGRLPMGDIVCFDDVPLKLVQPETEVADEKV